MIVVKYEFEKELEDVISKAFKNKNYVITGYEIDGKDIFAPNLFTKPREITVEGYIDTDDGEIIGFVFKKMLKE